MTREAAMALTLSGMPTLPRRNQARQGWVLVRRELTGTEILQFAHYLSIVRGRKVCRRASVRLWFFRPYLRPLSAKKYRDRISANLRYGFVHLLIRRVEVIKRSCRTPRLLARTTTARIRQAVELAFERTVATAV